MFDNEVNNVIEAIIRYGHDEDFIPRVSKHWQATDAVAGSSQKLEVLRNRVELGVPLFHPGDNQEYLGTRFADKMYVPAIRFMMKSRHRGRMFCE